MDVEKQKKALQMPLRLLTSEYLKRFGQSSKETAKAKSVDLGKFQSYVEKLSDKRPTLESISQKTIVDFRDSELERGMAASTVSRNLSTLRHFFGKIEREYLIRSPCEGVRSPSIPKAQPVPLTEEQRKVVRLTLPPTSVVRAAFEIAILTGLRISEVVSLRLWQIDDTTNRLLRVRCKGEKIRNVPYPIELMEILSPWIGARERMLMEHFQKKGANYNELSDDKKGEFPLLITCYRAHPVRPTSYSVSKSHIRKSLGVFGRELGFRANMHKSRKTFATVLYKESGHNIKLVSNMLGHANTVVTESYLGVSNEDEQEAIKIIGGSLAA